jgi:hypothetical protein
MSATGTAIQIQRVRPRGFILMCAVLAAAIGVGFFVGRVTERPAASGETAGVSTAIPELGWQTEGAAVRSHIYGKTFGSTDVVGTKSVGNVQPHLPKRGVETSIEGNAPTTAGVPRHHLPKSWNLSG